MTFSRIDRNSHYRDLRLRSTGGKWDLGLSQYATGIRVRMGLAERPPAVLDFCVGTDPRLLGPVFDAVLSRLEMIGEDASAEQIDALFPWAGGRADLAQYLHELLRDRPDHLQTVGATIPQYEKQYPGQD